MPFTIVRQDITKMKVDAIVNAANTDLQMGGGVCGAIFKAAGAAQLQAACDKLAPIKTGEAVITSGFDLPAKFVIHAAGPVYGWEFVFLGVNIDAVQTAGRFGIAPDRAVDYLADSEGTKLNFKVMASAVATFRESGTVDETCFEEIRKDVKRRGGRK